MNKELLINRHTNVVTQFCEDSEFSGAKWTLNGCRSNSISCIYDESILPTDMMRVYFLPTTILMSNAKHISNAIRTLRMQYM
jgi:hypothetical protein